MPELPLESAELQRLRSEGGCMSMKQYDTFLTVDLNGESKRSRRIVRCATLCAVFALLGVVALRGSPNGFWNAPEAYAAFDSTDQSVQADVPTVDEKRRLSPQQRRVVSYLSNRYRVSPEAVEDIVQVAYTLGKEEHVEPTLILAIVGVESSYNPFAASSMGAKGLMQVMPKLHKERFDELSEGEDWSALNPEMNLRVGAQIIREYTRRAGSVSAGLRWYVGAAASEDDGGYASKVLALKARIDAAYRADRWVATPDTKKTPIPESVHYEG